MATIQEFQVDFKGNTQGLQNAIKGIKAPLDNLAKSFAKIGGIIAGAFAVGGGVKAVADLGNELANFEAVSNVSGEAVSNLGVALSEFGGNTQDAMADLENLNNAMVESTQGQGALINVSKKYGVVLSNQKGSLKNITQIYTELQSQISKYDKGKQQQILKEMGLTKASINMIINKKNLESSLNNFDNKSIDSEEIKAGKEFFSIMKDIKLMFDKIAAVVLKSCMPAIKATFGFMQKVWNHLASTGFKIVKILGVIVGILITIKVVTIAISLAAQGVLWPFTLIAAIVALIVLIVEDIWTFFQGGDSITGRIVAKFKEWLEQHPKFKAFIDMLVNGFKAVWEWIKKAFDYITNFTWDGFINDLKNVGNAIYDAISKAISNAVSAGWEKFKGFFGFGGDVQGNKSVSNTNNYDNKQVKINQTFNASNSNDMKKAGETLKKQMQTQTQGG